MEANKENRLCRFCDSGSLEDEMHVLLPCAKFDSKRKEIFEEPTEIFPDFMEFDDVMKAKVLFMINAEIPRLATISEANNRYSSKTFDLMHACISVFFQS
mmetsp:Transcript_14662/g.19187  ORF Transcript_14662/g.19187 Transcript_14662/m.19187 type:complete len:100 (+) Transcript_14662:1-300(+)